MGWLSESSPACEAAPISQPVTTSAFGQTGGARPAVEQATIGRSLVIKGEISGVESLYIDGRVEGAILVPENRVTISPHGNVVSDIKAREVVIMGKVKGNILCGERADIRSGSVVTGEIIARRVMVEDGAAIKGSVEVRATEPARATAAPSIPSKSAEAQKKPEPEVAMAASAATENQTQPFPRPRRRRRSSPQPKSPGVLFC